MQFTVLGTIQKGTHSDGRYYKKFVPSSAQYMAQCLNRLPWGAHVTMSFKDKKPTKSQSQHNYHFALCNLIADHSGYTTEEAHDALMKLAFGVRKIKLLGRDFEARESMSNMRALTVSQCQELITKDLEVCAELDIHVPTLEELGYISNH